MAFTYTYWRLQVNNIGSNVCALADWKFYDGTVTQIPTTGGTATASDILGGNVPANAFDNNAGTIWATGYTPTPAVPAWIQYQFASAITPVTFSLGARSTEPEQMPDSITLLGSNDGTTWTTIGNYSASYTASQTRTFTVGNLGLGDIYRIVINSNDSGAQYGMSNVVFFDAGGSPLSFGNGAAMASSTFNPGFSSNGPSLALDGNAATAWTSLNTTAPQWWQFRFNGSVTVGSFSIQASTSTSQTPHTFTLQKSTDGGSVFVTVGTYTAATWTASAIQTFTVLLPPPPVPQRGNIDFDQIKSAARTGNGSQLHTWTTPAPTISSGFGTAGQIAWDSGFIYICTATNTWKRVAIASW